MSVQLYFPILGVLPFARYVGVFVEFAKAAPEDILIKISIANRGPDMACLHVVPHLWFRTTWWISPEAPKPVLRALSNKGRVLAAEETHRGPSANPADSIVMMFVRKK